MMIARVIVATILAAAILFVWGFLFWGVLPLGLAAMEEEPFGGEEMVNAMGKVLPNTGAYFIPYPPAAESATEDELKSFRERHVEGPIVRVFFNKVGAEPMAPSLFIAGFIHNLSIALLMSVILAAAAPALPGYVQRVGVVFLTAAVAAVWLGLNEAIWFYHPWKYELYQAGYVLVGGLLMGIVMAAIIKVKIVPPATAA